jgi:hypothetical protein
MLEYQLSKEDVIETEAVDHLRAENGPSPNTFLGQGRLDPFDTLARTPTPFESFLLDHCKPLAAPSSYALHPIIFLSVLVYCYHSILLSYHLLLPHR